MLSSANYLVSLALLGALLMPSPRLLDPHRRTHKRHATCEHHLRRHHPDPADRAKVLRRAQRRQSRLQERARLEEARRLLEALDESALTTFRAAADPVDDDKLKKNKRRRGKMKNRFWSLQDSPPKIRLESDFLATLRPYLETQDPRIGPTADVLPHFGSGPCHSIPRPREGTTNSSLPNDRVAA